MRLSAKLRGEAHLERWEAGDQAARDQRQGDATVAATINCDVGIRFEPGKLASDVLLDPHVTAISLELIDLDVHRLSKLGGKAAHELGDSFTPMVARQLKRREAKLVAKANASIAKHQRPAAAAGQPVHHDGLGEDPVATSGRIASRDGTQAGDRDQRSRGGPAASPSLRVATNSPPGAGRRPLASLKSSAWRRYLAAKRW